jgi:transposase-like protein
MHLTFAKRVFECPVCESSSVRRSMRKGFVERIWFRLAFVWPYRCNDCDSRFWGFQRFYQAMPVHLPAFDQTMPAYSVLAPARIEAGNDVFTKEPESLAHSYRSV